MQGEATGQGSSQGQAPTAVAFIEDPDMRRLFDYWRMKRAERPMPSREDIDPVDIAWTLSRIYIVDYSPESGFVYRLAGNEIAGVFGRGNLKGLRPRDFLAPQRVAAVEALFQRVVDDRSILWMKGRIYLRADRTAMGERLLLPLGDAAGQSVTGMLGMTVAHTAGTEADTENDGAAEDTKERFIPINAVP